MKAITIWKVLDKNGVAKHNHIEDGWVLRAYPEPLSEEYTNQKAWANMNWICVLGYLTGEGKVEVI